MPIPSPNPSVPSQGEHARPALARYNIVLANEVTAEAVVLDSAPDAEQATIAFHQTRQRLIQERVHGELVIVHHNQGARMLLREPLGDDSRSVRVRHAPRCADRHSAGVSSDAVD